MEGGSVPRLSPSVMKTQESDFVRTLEHRLSEIKDYTLNSPVFYKSLFLGPQCGVETVKNRPLVECNWTTVEPKERPP